MDIKKLIDEEKAGKVFIFIQSRLCEEDTSGFLQELEGFDILNLPLLYTGEASKDEFKQWRKVDN